MPKPTSSQRIIETVLAEADVRINGDRPGDIRVHNHELYDRVLSRGSLGLGEAYVDGWWDANQLDEFFTKILRAGLDQRVKGRFSWFQFPELVILQAGRWLRRSDRRAFEIGEVHYDLGNDLYRSMLDPQLTYTCGYWREAKTLAEAQTAKLDLVCRKIGIGPEDRVLDIGSGWGSFINFAAANYGARCVGVTVSKEQTAYANSKRNHQPVETRFQDYRDLDEPFDKVVSLGMFEHVGVKHYRSYLEKVHSLLPAGGLFLLHTIGSNVSVDDCDPWIAKYIFPNSMLPSGQQIMQAAEGLFVMEDWHNFGSDYDLTLMQWFQNFNYHWPELRPKYGDRFYRMWKYYLLASAGSFRSRKNQLWQIVFSKGGVRGGYRSIR